MTPGMPVVIQLSSSGSMGVGRPQGPERSDLYTCHDCHFALHTQEVWCHTLSNNQ